MRSYTDGSDSAFQRSISAIVPACLVIGLFALLGVLLTLHGTERYPAANDVCCLV